MNERSFIASGCPFRYAEQQRSHPRQVLLLKLEGCRFDKTPALPNRYAMLYPSLDSYSGVFGGMCGGIPRKLALTLREIFKPFQVKGK